MKAYREPIESMLSNGYDLRGPVWIILYLFFVSRPLFALLTGSLPPARGF